MRCGVHVVLQPAVSRCSKSSQEASSLSLTETCSSSSNIGACCRHVRGGRSHFFKDCSAWFSFLDHLFQCIPSFENCFPSHFYTVLWRFWRRHGRNRYTSRFVLQRRGHTNWIVPGKAAYFTLLSAIKLDFMTRSLAHLSLDGENVSDLLLSHSQLFLRLRERMIHYALD